MSEGQVLRPEPGPRRSPAATNPRQPLVQDESDSGGRRPDPGSMRDVSLGRCLIRRRPLHTCTDRPACSTTLRLWRASPALAGISRAERFSKAIGGRDERGISESRRSSTSAEATEHGDLQYFSGSDGTRTRDLRRDRPLRGSLRGRRRAPDRSVHAAFPDCSGASRMVERSRSRRLPPYCCPLRTSLEIWVDPSFSYNGMRRPAVTYW